MTTLKLAQAGVSAGEEPAAAFPESPRQGEKPWRMRGAWGQFSSHVPLPGIREK